MNNLKIVDCELKNSNVMIENESHYDQKTGGYLVGSSKRGFVMFGWKWARHDKFSFVVPTYHSDLKCLITFGNSQLSKLQKIVFFSFRLQLSSWNLIIQSKKYILFPKKSFLGGMKLPHFDNFGNIYYFDVKPNYFKKQCFFIINFCT